MIGKYLLQERGKKGSAWIPTVEFSFLEVYNERVYDLLNGQKHCPLTYQRTVLHPGSKYAAPQYANDERVVPQGLVRRPCDLEGMSQQVANWLSQGAASRITGRTGLQ